MVPARSLTGPYFFGGVGAGACTPLASAAGGGVTVFAASLAPWTVEPVVWGAVTGATTCAGAWAQAVEATKARAAETDRIVLSMVRSNQLCEGNCLSTAGLNDMFPSPCGVWPATKASVKSTPQARVHPHGNFSTSQIGRLPSLSPGVNASAFRVAA